MVSDPHLHYPSALSDHTEHEAIAQRHLAARTGAPVGPPLTLPLVLRLVVEAARRHLGQRGHGAPPTPRPGVERLGGRPHPSS